MVFEASMLDSKRLIECLKNEDRGFLLAQADKESMLDALAQAYPFNIPIFKEEGSDFVFFQLIPVGYEHTVENDHGLVQSRAFAVKEIFSLWSAAGFNKKRAKSPYGSRAFMKYLDSIGYFHADYVLLQVM